MPLTKQSTERLLRVADLLENLPKGKLKFDMSEWYRCGTVACAVGHAAMDPWFRRRGLTLTPETLWAGGPCTDGSMEPMFRGLTNSDAVEEFFGITEEHVERLFVDTAYPEHRRGPKTVAKRIRKFVKDKTNAF